MAFPDKISQPQVAAPSLPSDNKVTTPDHFCWTHYKHREVVIANFWTSPHFPRLLHDRTHSPPFLLSNISLLT